MTPEQKKLQDFLDDLGESIKMPNLRIDQDGYCCLAFDEKLNVHMQVNRKTSNLIFFAEIGTVHECDKLQAYTALLEANSKLSSLSGATLGFDKSKDMVTLAYQEPMKNFDSVSFQGFLKTFVELAEAWMAKLVDIQHTSMPGGVYHPIDYDASQMISV